MGVSVQPQQPTAADWQEYLQNALAAHRANPQDTEAMQAVRDAVAALNQLEQANVPKELGIGESVVGGFRGLGNLASSAIEGIPGLIAPFADPTAPRGPAGIPLETMLQLGQGMVGAVEAPIDVTRRAIGGEQVSPEEAAEAFGGAAALFAPVKAPRALRTAARGVTSPFRAVGDLLQRPGLRNQLLTERQGVAASQRALLEARLKEIVPQQAEQAGLRTQLLEQQVQRAPAQTEAALRRIQLMEQQLERGGPTLENVQLRNELMRLKIELMGEGAPSVAGATAEELAVAKQLGIPVEQVRGRVGAPAEPAALAPPQPVQPQPVQPAAVVPDILEQPAFQRAGGKVRTIGSTLGAGDLASLPSDLRLAEARAKFARHTPESIMGLEPVENLPMPGQVQKAVQFGEGSPLNPAAQAEILGLMGELQRILGEKGGR